jgi:hypothetical protein
MSATAMVTVPFESQSDPQNRRDCGAACLSMVYRSLGKEVAPAEIWPAIAKENTYGSIASTTHLMAKDALSRGFSAVAFQASHPLEALRHCRESGTRAILNHRPTSDSPAGHYSVLVDVDARDVVLHDPFYGPARRMPHAELLELWRPLPRISEIAGYTLIAISAPPPTPAPCWLCQTPMLAQIACPSCKQPVLLQPTSILGCMNAECVAHMWNYICCPSCDCGLTSTSQAAPLPPGPSSLEVPAAQQPSAGPANALDFTRLFAAVDKFCSHILTIPGAADHPGIKQRLDFLAASKEKLKLGAAESLERHRAHQEQLAGMMQSAKANEEAHRKKMEALNRPSPPLDGNSLGRALLKNLGFTE